MPILGVNGDILPRMNIKANTPHQTKRRRTKAHKVTIAPLKPWKAKITEAQAKHIYDMKDARRLRDIFRED